MAVNLNIQHMDLLRCEFSVAHGAFLVLLKGHRNTGMTKHMSAYRRGGTIQEWILKAHRTANCLFWWFILDPSTLRCVFGIA